MPRRICWSLLSFLRKSANACPNLITLSLRTTTLPFRLLQFTHLIHTVPSLHTSLPRVSRRMSKVPINQIPTVSDLLLDEDEHESQKAVSKKINDKVGLIQKDITTLEVDAIVNAANKSLLGGGGVDGRIHAVCGPQLKAECRELGGCDTGDAKITSAYGSRIACTHILHTVGPIYDAYPRNEAARYLKSCYTRSLEVLVKNGLTSIAFSCISTGVYGYPSIAAAKIACEAVREFLESNRGESVDKVVFCTYEDKDQIAYERMLPRFFPITRTSSEAPANPDVNTTTIQQVEDTPSGAIVEPSTGLTKDDTSEPTDQEPAGGEEEGITRATATKPLETTDEKPPRYEEIKISSANTATDEDEWINVETKDVESNQEGSGKDTK